MTTMGLCSESYGSTGGFSVPSGTLRRKCGRAEELTSLASAKPRSRLPWRPSPRPDDEKQRPASDNQSVRQLARFGARDIQLLAGVRGLQSAQSLEKKSHVPQRVA